MPTNYPSSKQTFSDPNGTNTLDSPDHASLHTNVNDTLEALQDTVGTTAGTNVLSNFAAGQFPLRVTGGGATGTHISTLVGGTLNNNVYGTPTFTFGSDATGDTFYRTAGGTASRLAVGTAGQLLGVSAGLPAWVNGTFTPDTGWILDTVNTWSYSGNDGATGTVTVPADLTGSIQLGDRIAVTQTSEKYFIVTKTPALASGTTTIVMWGGTQYTLANAAITAPKYSHVKSPFGFNPTPANWTIITKDTSSIQISAPASGTWYNPGTVNAIIHPGVWDVNYELSIQANDETAGQYAVSTTLSTGTASESDTEFTTYQGLNVPANSAAGASVYREKHLTLTSKTTYYLNIKTSTANLAGFTCNNDLAPAFIRAVCALL